MLRLIPLGGLGEIGLNMTIFECADSMMVVDAGLMFPEDHMLGVDFVIPDMSYVRLNKNRLTGVVLTHAHEDHIGALPFLLRDVHVPVFGTPFTLGLVRQKLEDLEIAIPAGLHVVSPEQPLSLGPFRVDFIRVGHSVVDGVGLAIHTPEGLVVHTGDFKLSPCAFGGMSTDIQKFARCGETGVLALMSDSTNIEREGATLPETRIEETLSRVVAESPGRIIVALFASNIARIQMMVDIGRKAGRKVIISGRNIEASVEIAKALGYLQVATGCDVSIDLVQDFPEDEVLIITTGSQGEPMSALARMASGAHKQIKIKKGDTVVLSSKFIPGNERAITRIIDNLYRKGAEVVYEKIADVHVSGHAFRDELRQMIHLTHPRYFIPVHGEYRHLVLHGRLAQEAGIGRENVLLAENGQVIEFENRAGRIHGSVDTGRVLIDGKGVGDVGRSVLKERRMLSEEGFVAVTLAFDEETGIIVYGPEIVSRGFVFETETGYLLEDAQCVVLEVVEELPPETPHRIDRIRSRLQGALRQYFFFTIGRRPFILPFIMEV
ncbi:MAG: ribonuclease J [Desulfobacterales bacterium]